MTFSVCLRSPFHVPFSVLAPLRIILSTIVFKFSAAKRKTYLSYRILTILQLPQFDALRYFFQKQVSLP